MKVGGVKKERVERIYVAGGVEQGLSVGIGRGLSIFLGPWL